MSTSVQTLIANDVFLTSTQLLIIALWAKCSSQSSRMRLSPVIQYMEPQGFQVFSLQGCNGKWPKAWSSHLICIKWSRLQLVIEKQGLQIAQIPTVLLYLDLYRSRSSSASLQGVCLCIEKLLCFLFAAFSLTNAYFSVICTPKMQTETKTNKWELLW